MEWLRRELSICREDLERVSIERDEWKWAARNWSNRYLNRFARTAPSGEQTDLERVLAKTATATMLCGKCGCPIFGGAGGYHTVDGRERCPASWDPADAYHEPTNPCNLCGGSGSIIGDHTNPFDGDYADFHCPNC